MPPILRSKWSLAILLWLPFCCRAAVPTAITLPPFFAEAGGLVSDPPSYGGAWHATSTVVFVDLMKHSAPMWLEGRRPPGWTYSLQKQESIVWRADGYPADLAPPTICDPGYKMIQPVPYACILTGMELSAYTRIGSYINYYVPGSVGAFYPAGKYIVLWDGNGTVSVDGDARTLASQPGRMEIQLTPNTGFGVRINKTDAADPVRYIRVVPEEFELTYEQQAFHPDFLAQVSGFKVLRFAEWLRVFGTPGGVLMLPRTWAGRRTPRYSTQMPMYNYQNANLPIGVAAEHIVQLCNKIGASPWFSLPSASNDSDSFHAGLAAYVAQSLRPGLKVYIQWGESLAASVWMNNIWATSTQTVAAIWRRTWADQGCDPSRLVVVANSPYGGLMYFWMYFGTTNTNDNSWKNSGIVDAIAIQGGYGSGSFSGNFLNHMDTSVDSFLTDNPNLTRAQLAALVRQYVIAADVTANRAFNQIKLKDKQLGVLAIQGGPNFFAANNRRYNYQQVLSCSSYPCTKTLYYSSATIGGSSSTRSWSVTFNSGTERNASLPDYEAQARQEWQLEEWLWDLKLRDPATKEHTLDNLWRWESMGGDVFSAQLPFQIACPKPGSVPLPPAACVNRNLLSVTPANNPIMMALKAYQAGGRSTLPRSAAEAPPSPAPQACDPACRYGDCVKGECVCWAGYNGTTCSVRGIMPADCNKFVGVNLERIADWARSWTFINVMRHGRAWVSADFNMNEGGANSNPISLGPLDYPKQLLPQQYVGTFLIRDLQRHYPSGVYTVLYDGEGVINFSMDIGGVRYVEAGRIEVNLTLTTGMNNGMYLKIDRTNPNNPIRNIRVLMPGFDEDTEQAVPFHPRFLNFLRGFNAIRFLDWMRTNEVASELPATWDQRPTRAHRSYASAKGGASLEDMVKLCNIVGAAPWFTMPFTADDDYHRQFATYVKANLRPDQKVYVEWANEVWGAGFPCGQFAQSEGVRLGLNETNNFYWGSVTEARLCYVAERIKRMSAVWKDVFSGNPGRVVIVAGAQVANGNGITRKILTCRNVTSHIDAVALAPYFGTFNPNLDKSLDVFMNTTLPKQVDDVAKAIAPHYSVISEFNKPMMCYEAGQSMGYDGISYQAQKDSRMYGVYNRYLSMLAATNMTQVMHYHSIGVWAKNSYWGLMEWQDADPDTMPKYKAVKDFISSATCPVDVPPDPVDDTPIDHYDCGYNCTFGQGFCNNLTKVDGRDRWWGCTCKPGFFGTTCARFTCPNNCNYAGSCVDNGICVCYPGFTGPDCQTDCGCNGHGTCAADNTCMCDAGYKLGPNGCEWDCDCADAAACIGPGECGCSSPCEHGTCFQGRCECWAGYTGDACDQPAKKPNDGSPIGMNVASVNYWQTQWVWVDVMKQSGDWAVANAPDIGAQSWTTDGTLDLSATGYPTSLPANKIAHKLTVRDVLLKAMPGHYVVLYDGEGTLEFGFDSKVVSVGKGRVEILFTPTADLACAATFASYCGDNGIWLKLTNTNPANPLRNIRLTMPGFEATAARQPFHPWFLKSLERYSVLRFMDWMKANSEEQMDWATRTTPQHDTQARPQGVALEHIIQLCNQLGASPWINVHHSASDEYVSNMARMLLSKLRPDVQVYVEHSNEVWHTGFGGGKYVRKRGLELNLSTDSTLAGLRYHALRSGQIFDIFTQVFGQEARAARLKFVVGSAGADIIDKTLSYANIAGKADMVAVTGYFGCRLGQDAAHDMLLSLDEMLDRCNASVGDVATTMAPLKAAAAKYGLPLTTYEAGPSIVEAAIFNGKNPTTGAADKYIAVQRDPRFHAVYSAYLAAYEAEGVVAPATPYMHYASTRVPHVSGSWGLLEYTGQPAESAPKYLAVRGLLDRRQDPVNPSACMSPELGYRALGDKSFYGLPAVMTPAKGDVWVQGYKYNISWPRGHAPVGPLNIALYRFTNCNGTTPLASWTNQAVLMTPYEAWLTLTAPSDVAGSDLFLQITSPSTSHRNFTELFRIERQHVARASAWGACSATCDGSTAVAAGIQTRSVRCIVNPRAPPADTSVVLSNFCSVQFKLNTTQVRVGDDKCTIDSNGCRNYRTPRNVSPEWFSYFKPILDCTAQYSPNPSPAALAAAGIPVGPPVPGSTVDSSLCTMPATEQACTKQCD